MEWLYIIIGVALGIVLGYLFAKSKWNNLSARADIAEKERERLQQLLQKMQHDLDFQKEHEHCELQKQQNHLQAEHLQRLDLQREELKRDYAQQLAQWREQQGQQMKQQLEMLSQHLENISQQALRKRSEQLSETNKEQLGAILEPLQENIRQMRQAVEKSDREHTTSMERLDEAIRTTLQSTKDIGERADRLAHALTGESKTQGNFGELRLKQLLEQMGFEEGLQYEEQVTLRDEHGNALHDTELGHRLQPDIILHFPDERDVIIDSKLSFTAFIDYQNATDEATRNEALRRHITSMRSHVAELARKDYSHYLREKGHALDFVIMYVFQESALQLALCNDTTLWREAYDRHVLICGSQNLYALLRVLEHTWKQMRQAENQQEIMRCANEIINRTQLFYERFLHAEEQLERTRQAFKDVKTSTAPSGVSIITAANNLLRYGATENPKRKQRLPKQNQEDTDEKLLS